MEEFPPEIPKLKKELKKIPRKKASARKRILEEIVWIESLYIRARLESILDSDGQNIKTILKDYEKYEIIDRVFKKNELLKQIILAEVFSDRRRAIMIRTYGDH